MSEFTTDRPARLDDLRSALLAAAAADLAGEVEPPTAPLPRAAVRPPRRLQLTTARARLALALLIAVLAVPAVLFGSGLLGPERAVANGLPAGTRTVTAVQPDCAAIRAGVEYECAFATAPRVGRIVRTVDASGQVDGGCRSQNAIETFWICYFGDAAVQHGVVAPGVL